MFILPEKRYTHTRTIQNDFPGSTGGKEPACQCKKC